MCRRSSCAAQQNPEDEDIQRRINQLFQIKVWTQIHRRSETSYHSSSTDPSHWAGPFGGFQLIFTKHGTSHLISPHIINVFKEFWLDNNFSGYAIIWIFWMWSRVTLQSLSCDVMIKTWQVCFSFDHSSCCNMDMFTSPEPTVIKLRIFTNMIDVHVTQHADS